MEKLTKYQKYHRKNKAKRNVQGKEYYANIRNAALELLGARCVRCQFADKRALHIDHINGGGSQERKNKLIKGNFCKEVVRSFLASENKYQILCANCNWIKRVEEKEVFGRPKLN